MTHLDDEQILAALRSRGAQPGAEDAPEGARHPVGSGPAEPGTERHLADCADCRRRVAAAAALRDAATAVEASEAPDAAATGEAVPAFDALVLPALRRTAEPEPAPARERGMGGAAAGAEPAASEPAAAAEQWESPEPSAPVSWRLTAALALRQARLVPRALWPLTALGFTALLVLASRMGEHVGLLLGPGVTLLVTAGVLAVCEPRRDPRRELLYAMPVPPVAVWLARLVLVVGANLAAATALTVAAARLPSGGADATGLVALWLGPALLTAALAAFGSVWQSPVVGAVLGACGWLAGAAAAAGDLVPAPGSFLRLAAAAWTTNPGTLGATLILVCAAAFLVTRPRRAL